MRLNYEKKRRNEIKMNQYILNYTIIINFKSYKNILNESLKVFICSIIIIKIKISKIIFYVI